MKTRRTYKSYAPLFLGLSLVAAGCSDQGFKVAEKISKDVSSESSCEDFSGTLTKTLIQSLIDAENMPTEAQLRQSLTANLGSSQTELVEKTVEVFKLLTTDTQARLGLKNKDELIEAITALDIGDETTPERAQLKSDLRRSFTSLKTSAVRANVECQPQLEEETTTAPEPITQVPTADTKVNLAAAGAQKVLMTAYQSCAAAKLPAMTSASRSIASGAIKITGTHSSGTGLKREVGNLALLQQSHYYVREGIEKGASCFNVTKSPLIYDYGGKPYATTALSSSLDYFKNAGSGTKVLGVDCSGFVFSALASQGLRVSPSKRAQAYLVFGINARMYMNPKSNGLTCLAPVPSQKSDSLRSGDILASTGHIIMVDNVGKDPFGVAGIKSASGCVAANMSTSKFDFDILQSAPIKGGIGINRVRAATYLGEGGSMQTAMLQYALAACKANFGTASTPLPTSARLVRHKLTSDCMDKPVALAGESCVATCNR